MQRVWILNDLFVSEAARGSGVGRALLGAAIRFAEKTGAARVELATAKDNRVAKALYDSTGFQIDSVFDHYQLSIT